MAQMSSGNLFSTVKKGYDTGEVDVYVEELDSRCKYLQEQNAVLTHKLADAQDMIRRYSEAEKGLRMSIAQSKRAAADMLSDARSRSSALLEAAREECSTIIDELDARIEERYRTIEQIRGSVAAFKTQLFELYSKHIEMVDAAASTAESFSYEPDFGGISEAIETFEEGGEPECPAAPEFPECPEESFFENAEAALNPKDFSMEGQSEAASTEPEDTPEEPEDDFFVSGESSAAEPETDESDDFFGAPDAALDADKEFISDFTVTAEPEISMPSAQELFEELDSSETPAAEEIAFETSEQVPDAAPEDDFVREPEDDMWETEEQPSAEELESEPEYDGELDAEDEPEKAAEDVKNPFEDDMFGNEPPKTTEDYFKFLDDFVNGSEE